MQSTILICLAAIAATAQAQVYMPPAYVNTYPGFYKYSKLARHPRDVRDLKWSGDFGGGKIFGSLDPDNLSGMGGYRRDIFDDSRGRLQGTAYGSRSLLEDSSKLGGKLDWTNANRNVRAGLDVHKEIGGISGMRATGEGVWKLDKDTRLVGGAFVDKQFGGRGPEGGLEAKIEHDF